MKMKKKQIFSWNNTVNNSNGNNDDSAATEEVLPDEISSNGEDIEEEQDTPFTFIDTE